MQSDTIRRNPRSSLCADCAVTVLGCDCAVPVLCPIRVLQDPDALHPAHHVLEPGYDDAFIITYDIIMTQHYDASIRPALRRSLPRFHQRTVATVPCRVACIALPDMLRADWRVRGWVGVGPNRGRGCPLQGSR